MVFRPPHFREPGAIENVSDPIETPDEDEPADPTPESPSPRPKPSTSKPTGSQDGSEAVSASRMLQLMRVELDRAKEHDYPISCLMIGLDGLGPDATPLKQRLGQRLTLDVFRILKKVTFRNRVKGLGLRRDAFVLALFPHVPPQRTEELASEMLADVRELRPHSLAKEGLTASAGVGHNLHPGEVTLESLLVEAETGLNIAQSAGGDRCVTWKEIESELEHLRDELDTQIRDLEERRKLSREDAEAEEAWGRELLEKLLEVFADEEGASKQVLRIEKRVIDIVAEDLERLADLPSSRQLADREQEIDTLERRIRKLTDRLDKTEAELQRVAAMKVVDDGIASIYRSVQGLSDDAEGAEQKKAMLDNIFVANMALRDSTEKATA